MGKIFTLIWTGTFVNCNPFKYLPTSFQCTLLGSNFQHVDYLSSIKRESTFSPSVHLIDSLTLSSIHFFQVVRLQLSDIGSGYIFFSSFFLSVALLTSTSGIVCQESLFQHGNVLERGNVQLFFGTDLIYRYLFRCSEVTERIIKTKLYVGF